MEDGGLMEDDGRGTICIAFQAKRECCGSHTPGLHPGLLPLRSVASSSRDGVHTVSTAGIATNTKM
jgi:hypothetical protein